MSGGGVAWRADTCANAAKNAETVADRSASDIGRQGDATCSKKLTINSEETTPYSRDMASDTRESAVDCPENLTSTPANDDDIQGIAIDSEETPIDTPEMTPCSEEIVINIGETGIIR